MSSNPSFDLAIYDLDKKRDFGISTTLNDRNLTSIGTFENKKNPKPLRASDFHMIDDFIIAIEKPKARAH